MIFDKGAPPPCPVNFNMAEYVLAAGLSCPDKVALVITGLTGAERWSYAKLRTVILTTATGLLNAGGKPGTRVLMRLGNCQEFPITYLAAIAVGMIPVPTSSQLTVGEVEKICSEIRPDIIVGDPELGMPENTTAQRIEPKDFPAFKELEEAQFDRGDPNRPAYIIYTSGTSGTPRAVTHAHRAIWARRMMWQDWYGLKSTDRVMHAGAFNWTYTLGTGLMDPWAIGATALIPDPSVHAEQLPLLLKRHDASIFAAAPGVYRRLLRSIIPSLPKLRHGLSAGEKLPDVTRKAWEAATKTPIHEAYGMSECSTFISGSPDRMAPAGTLGFPQTGRRVAVLTDQTIADANKPGVLAVSTNDPGVMLGYWNSAKDAPDLVPGDWFETGDTVSMAKDGAITYLGRQDDMMNAGGFRVSPIEVEAAMNLHNGIHECAAVEMRVSDDTSIITLFYVSDQTLAPDELQSFAAERLARYKCPRSFERIDAIPRGANNKILRRNLRAHSEVQNG